MGSRTHVTGLSALTTVVQNGRGAVVASAHLGNWELGGAALTARGIPMDVVARGQRNVLFDNDLTATRRSLGMRVVSQAQARRGVLGALREGRVVGLVADQDAGGDGVFVDFFGYAASTARGPALFALRTGSPLYLGLAVREPGLPQRYTIHLEPIEIEPTGDRDRDVQAMVQAYTTRLEAAIRAHPAQYFWHHRRWKTRPSTPAPSHGNVEEPGQEADVLPNETGESASPPPRGSGTERPPGEGVTGERDGDLT